MDTDRLLEQLQIQGELLAQSAESTDPHTAIPSCPGWTVAGAVAHLSKVYRATSWVIGGGDRAEFDYQPPEPLIPDEELRAGLADLIAALRAAPDTLSVFTFWPAKSARQFWARRQAHETAIHRVDVQLAAGYGVLDFEPDFAADGIDELLMGMAAHAFDRSGLGRQCTIALTPLDANSSWTIRLTPDQVAVRPSAADDADLSIFGLSSDLYRWVWNRAGDDEVSLRGEVSLADLWHTNFHVGGGPAAG